MYRISILLTFSLCFNFLFSGGDDILNSPRIQPNPSSDNDTRWDCSSCNWDFDGEEYDGCCDTAWDVWGVVEDDYGWDCSGCLCPGDASEIIRCTGSDWQSCIDDATCNSSIIVSSENQNSVLNINKNITLIADQGCLDSQVPDCDGSDQCCPEGWIGDGLCDGEDQNWGCDLSCYDNDDGDCGRSGTQEFNEENFLESRSDSRAAAGSRRRTKRGMY